MSEEEKKAIDEFNKLLDDFKGLSKLSLWYEIDAEKQNELYNKLSPLLNLIENQQKEIEEKNVAINKMSKDISRQLKEIEKLNFENHMLKKWNEQLDQECISKDKIKEKIKEQIQKYFDIHDGKHSINEICFESTKVEGAVEVLKELLEEN